MLADRAVPRYTSYPTAPHFNSAVNPMVYASWLDQLPTHAKLSVYLHVPFCRELCLYCGCHTKAVRQRGPVDDYFDAIFSEIGIVGRLLKGQAVDHWHWGGGTPSLLKPEQFLAIADEFARYVDLDAIREHAIELDPRYVDADVVRSLQRIGVNRASLGVQDLSPDVQEAIGRIQPYEKVAHAVDLLRDAGIVNINFDLMYGLPRQTSGRVAATAERVCALKPARIALFGYAHVPWFKKQQRLIDEKKLPDLAARYAQMQAARDVFLAHGYVAIGFDHFALPTDTLAVAAAAGNLHRNFQGYTIDDAAALLGFGASSIGRLPQGYVQNAPDVGGYARAIGSGQLATVRGVSLSAEDRVRAGIIERLLCDMEVDLREYSAPQADAHFANEVANLKPYAAEALVQLGPMSIKVTEAGRAYLRLIAAAFDSYLPQGGKAHSRAL
ncbi:MAG: oxygen-independent coproporphyrinogen III oxidase [Xanthobacteraceae bacterium]